MTYTKLISELISSAKKEPNVRQIVISDIYKMNALNDIDYVTFGITPNNWTQDETFRTYSLNLYYIDRIDESGVNQEYIQSAGTEVLSNVIARFVDKNDNVSIEYPMTFVPFQQRFTDLCSGVYVTLRITVPLSDICYEDE